MLRTKGGAERQRAAGLKPHASTARQTAMRSSAAACWKAPCCTVCTTRGNVCGSRRPRWAWQRAAQHAWHRRRVGSWHALRDALRGGTLYNGVACFVLFATHRTVQTISESVLHTHSACSSQIGTHLQDSFETPELDLWPPSAGNSLDACLKVARLRLDCLEIALCRVLHAPMPLTAYTVQGSSTPIARMTVIFDQRAHSQSAAQRPSCMCHQA